ncbi:hypothetical protein Pcinc_020120 [Petrolisthes cinctipes]|uniref:Kinesin motor domain-containing protein n=1 Tax=Petrolisthes cinctipes TaxID=88211 RepID=A0AAE1FK76_PETCI|nr:hypothetical protein Pcinc_020120 [Petrolisthes cinctipes]
MTLNRRALHRLHSPLKSPRLNASSLRKKALIKRLSGEVQFGADTKANLKVVVRVRPFNQREEDNNARCILDVVDEHMLVFDPRRNENQFFFKGALQRNRDLHKRQPREQKFIFERVFSTQSTNEDIYDASTHDLLDTLLSGYNCSVFAYGATGAGKTFTMLGTEESPGITFLTLKELYKRIEDLKETKTIEVAVSYLEVYNEMVRDLIITGKALSVQEVEKQVMVPGLSLHKPVDAQELMQLLIQGNHNRTQHPTDSNAESSRSHAVFQVFVKQHDRVVSDLKSNVSISKLSMIDLAGSERGAATGFKGVRFREGASINKSLLALGNCINALADGLRHIPYRDSKLTRLLKDSLGGNCRSVMIAAVSPASTTFEDTFNTLRYANRAKTIKTTIKKNVLNVDQHISNYVNIVEGLRGEICLLQAKIKTYEEKEKEMEQQHGALMATTSASPQSEFTLQQKQELEARIVDLEMQLKTRSMEEGKNEITKEDPEVQQRVEDSIQACKNLRHELLRLESSQRQLEFKMNGCAARLNRMRIISFASQKLDKCILRCERTILKLADRQAQIAKLKSEMRVKLAASVDHLQQLQSQLSSPLSKQYLEANLAVRDYHQHCQYLGGLIGDAFVEQNASEQLICQLLRATRQFYIQLHADNQSSPAFMEIFKSVVESLDEKSKVVWADQQGGKNSGDQQQQQGGDGASGMENSNSTTANSVDIVPQLDAKYFASFPITPTVTISPVVTLGQPKTFRISSMKTNTSALTLPQLPTQCLASSQDPRPTSSLLSPCLETEQMSNPGQPSTACPSPVTSDSCHKVPTSTDRSRMEQLDDNQFVTEKAPNLPDNTLQLMPNATTRSTTPQLMIKPPTLESITSSQQYCTVVGSSAVEALNVTDVFEDIQPVKCSLNETFSATPGKILKTTIDLPSSSVLIQDIQPDITTNQMKSDANLLSDKLQGTQGTIGSVTPIFGFTSLTQRCGVATGTTIGGVNDAHGTYMLKDIKSSPFLRIQSVVKPDVPSTSLSSSLSVPSNCQKNYRSSSDRAQETEAFNKFVSDVSSNPCYNTSHTAEQATTSAVRMLFPPLKPSLDSTFCITDDKSPAEAEHTPGITLMPTGHARVSSPEQSSNERESQQQLPLQSLPDNNRNDQTISTIISTTAWERVMQQPPKVKSKHGLSRTPHKWSNKNTPGILARSTTTSTSTLSKTLNGKMRRCVSTSSLAAPLAAMSTCKIAKRSPNLSRKLSGLHQSSSILKSRTPIYNQENVAPDSTKKKVCQSSIYRDTVSSAAKHSINLSKQ